MGCRTWCKQGAGSSGFSVSTVIDGAGAQLSAGADHSGFTEWTAPPRAWVNGDHFPRVSPGLES
eukprot:scaffold38913_cov36-Phaeocystis_antarctica.AAC.1